MGMCIGYSPYNAEQSVITQAIAVLRRFGSDAHIYLPGVGMLNGLQAGNYLDSAGTTQGAVDQPVGLVLDAAGGLGPNILGPSWTTSGGVTVSGGVIAMKSISDVFAYQDVMTIGSTYRVEFSYTVTSRNTGLYVGTNAATGENIISLGALTGSGVFSGVFKASHAGFIFRDSSLGCVVDIVNPVLREVTGIHASQTTTSNKCILRQTGGRYNWVFDATDLLTATYPAGYESVTVIDARSTGQVTTAGANIVGANSMGPSVTLYGRMIVKGVLTASELALLQRFANSLAGL